MRASATSQPSVFPFLSCKVVAMILSTGTPALTSRKIAYALVRQLSSSLSLLRFHLLMAQLWQQVSA